MDNTRTLCRPNDRLACCACCGLFNLADISRDCLYNYLSSGIQRLHREPSELDGNRHLGGLGLRDDTTHVCPFQGFIGDEERPGCLAHPAVQTADFRDRSLFQSKICEDFLCPAHDLLDVFHRKILLEAVDDWYAYSIAIIDPDSFIWIADAIGERDDTLITGIIRPNVGRAITQSLLIHADSLDRFPGSLFHYSVSEYRLHGRHYSLKENGDDKEAERRSILLEIGRL